VRVRPDFARLAAASLDAEARAFSLRARRRLTMSPMFSRVTPLRLSSQRSYYLTARLAVRRPLAALIRAVIGDAGVAGAIGSLARQFLRAAETKFGLRRIADWPAAHRLPQFHDGHGFANRHDNVRLHPGPRSFHHHGCKARAVLPMEAWALGRGCASRRGALWCDEAGTCPTGVFTRPESRACRLCRSPRCG